MNALPSAPSGSRTASSRATVVAALVTFGLVATACTGPATDSRDKGATGAGSTPASASPSPTPPPTSPFTGRRGATNKPVLAVKIDNVAAARPQTGLSKASLVYVEMVEGGLTRIMAVFSERLPKTVGPIRSVRRSDLELLRQFGRPALAYSGAHPKLRRPVRRAPLVRASPEQVSRGYFRRAAREAPHNLYAHPRRLLAQVSGVSEPRDIGFRFGPAPPGGKRVGRRTAEYPSASYTFHWSKRQQRWLVSMDGEPVRTTEDGRAGAPTVVIQRVDVHPGRLRDPVGAVSPVTETVGRGTALVLRDGRVYHTRWSRPRPKAGTTFTTRSGKPMTFDRGQVWILLTPR